MFSNAWTFGSVGGTLSDITVPDGNVREKIMHNNPKFLSNNDMKEMQKKQMNLPFISWLMMEEIAPS